MQPVCTNKDSEYVTSGFEFETLGLLGSNCGITDIDLLARLARLCDDLGLDTMEVGAALGVAMEGGMLDSGDGPGAYPLVCLLYTSPSPRDRTRSRMPSSA